MKIAPLFEVDKEIFEPEIERILDGVDLHGITYEIALEIAFHIIQSPHYSFLFEIYKRNLSENDAREQLFTLFEYVFHLLEDIGSQQEFEERINNNEDSLLCYDHAIHLLAPLKQMSSFSIDVESLIQRFYSFESIGNNSSLSAGLIQFFLLWIEEVSLEFADDILTSLIKKEGFYAFLFALKNYHILIKYFDVSSNLIQYLKKESDLSNDSLVSYLMTLDAYEIPDFLIEKLPSTLLWRSIVDLNSSIRINSQVDGDDGSCGYMRKWHKLTFLNEKEDDVEGKLVLIYIKNQLIGSMKLEGEGTILALQNVFDKNGVSLMKIAQVYATQADTVDRIVKLFDDSGKKRWLKIELSDLEIKPIGLLAEGEEEQIDLIRRIRQVVIDRGLE